MVRSTKTDDENFVIEWTTTTGKFGFISSRSIGDKVIVCSRTSSTKEGHDCVVRVCNSLAAG